MSLRANNDNVNIKNQLQVFAFSNASAAFFSAAFFSAAFFSAAYLMANSFSNIISAVLYSPHVLQLKYNNSFARRIFINSYTTKSPLILILLKSKYSFSNDL